MFFIYLIIAYFVWAYIHEYCHLYALKQIRDVKSYNFRLYPHKHEELGFVFASVSYDYNVDLDEKEWAYVSFAPRIADYMSVFTFLITYMFLGPLPQIFTVILLGGCIDLLRGSYIRNETSDIVRYCEGWDWDEQKTQIFQINLAMLPIVIYMYDLWS